ncbi:MAG TPA: hydroxymethylglutaryl-CoA lyase [Jiangellaceae bacterium]|nr:hydroxymethylglutaryl-CoA lyase [Jiangellaceae bacterium]
MTAPTTHGLPGSVSIREVGPRDGLQNEPPVSTEDKVELLSALSHTGLRRIEAVSFVHPRAIPQMADAEQVWSSISPADGVRYSALVPNLRGAERALQAGFGELEVVVSASDTHNRANLNRSTQDSLAELPALAQAARTGGASLQLIVSTAWGCPYEGDIAVAAVLDVARAGIEAGAESVVYGDTTGMATPTRVTELVRASHEAFGSLPLGLHLHNTRGTGLANVYAGLLAGVDDFDASVGGLGGCPYAPGASGNIATEELVHMLEDMGVATGVDLDALLGVAARAEQIMGRELPSQVLRAGPRTRLTPLPPVSHG